MSDALDVYLHGDRVGRLERRSRARLSFAYASEWVEAESLPISLSLPVRSRPYEHDECVPFFEGLLPEGEFLKAISRTLHISARNSFQLLAEIGGECAGAISVGPVGGPLPGRSERPPRWLDERQLRDLLSDLPDRPLLGAIDEETGFRISLAGAQDKVGVLFDGRRIGVSPGNPPSTHIVKTPIPGVADAIANEAFCMTLAARAGLDVARPNRASLTVASTCSFTATTATMLGNPTDGFTRRTSARRSGSFRLSSTKTRAGRISSIARR